MRGCSACWPAAPTSSGAAASSARSSPAWRCYLPLKLIARLVGLPSLRDRLGPALATSSARISMNILRFQDLVAAGRVAGRRVFIRADLNVPLDDSGQITEDTRIRASLPCIEHGARCRRRGDGHLAPRPPDRRPVQARGFARAGGAAPRRTARPRGAAGARLGRRRRGRAGLARAARELPPQQGREEERSGAGAPDGRAVRHLRARRLRHRAPRRGQHLRHRRARADRLRRAAAVGRDRRDHARRWPRRAGRWWRSSPAARSAAS